MDLAPARRLFAAIREGCHLPENDPRAQWNRPILVAEVIAQRVVDLVCEVMPQHLGVQAEDIQVLCPARRTSLA